MTRRCFLILVSLLLSLNVSAAGQSGFIRVLIRPTIPEAPIPLDAIAAHGAINPRVYDAFTLTEIPSGRLEGLRQAGARSGWIVQDVDHWRQLRMPGWTVDASNPSLPATGVLEGYPDGVGLFALQFNGPIREAWFSDLRAAGLDYIGYLPHNGALVVAKDADVQRFARRHYIDWVSLYHPAFRDQPMTLGEVESRRFTVQFAARPEAEGAIARLRASSTTPAERVEYGRYVNIEATLDPREVRTFLDDPFVVGITEPGVIRPSGERESLALSGLNPAPDTYRNWLSIRGVSDTTNYWIAVADTGFVGGEKSTYYDGDAHQDFFLPLSGGRWTPNRPLQWKDYSDADGSDVDGHGTAVAGVAMGDPPSMTGTRDSAGFWYGLGVAPKTGLIIQRVFSLTFDSQGRRVLNRQGTLWDWLSDARSLGASVQSQSLNSYSSSANGSYLARDQETDIAIRDLHLAVTGSVGNKYSDSTILNATTTSTLSPAVAKNIISVGGTESYRPEWSGDCPKPDTGTDPAWLTARSWNNIAYLSRRNTADGRIKPDIVAPSTLISTALYEREGITRPPGWCWHSPDNRYLISSGTSFSSPQAAAAIVLMQAKHGLARPSAALAKAFLVGTARSIKGGKDAQRGDETIRSIPDNYTGQGWGRLNLDEALSTAVQHQFDEQELSASRLTRKWNYAFSGAGQSRSGNFRALDPTRPVILVLAWTDEPANTGTNPVLVNDLTLKVSADEHLYYGNVLSDEWSLNVVPVCTSGEDWQACFIPQYELDERNNVQVIRIPPGELSGWFTVEVTSDKWGSGYVDYYSQPFAVYAQNACRVC
jgi:hypothetical protein